MATIRDVAERAGISVKTVSRYLSGYQGISTKTVNKIEKAAQELEYFPSAAAQSLRGQSSGIVGLIADELTTTPFSVDIVKGIQSVCDAEGKLLLIGETQSQQHVFVRQVERFRRQKTEAIIKATAFHKEIVIEQKFERCPLVLVNCYDQQRKYSSVLPNDMQGGYAITQRLISLGHKAIANITLLEDMVATKLRSDGFTRAMNEAGIKIKSDWVVPSSRYDAEYSATGLKKILAEFFSKTRKPSAIICGNDKMAFRVMMQLHGMGIEIPRDVSVVGFDDFQLLSANTMPPLTTVKLPYFEMGAKAAKLALELAHSSKRQGVEYLCRCDVVPRESDRQLRTKRRNKSN